MSSITQTQRYLPHTLDTKVYAVRLYRSGSSVRFVCRKYHISKASLMRWNRKYDGTRESLMDKSHRPHNTHPSTHTEQELKWISDLLRRNPHISVCELYGKLRKKGYTRHPGSLYRVLRRMGLRTTKTPKKKKQHNGHYDTPTELGVKWQMDVKYVPNACYTGQTPDKFYQYTMIDEASRERFIFPFMEQSSYSTVEFVKMAIRYFGYKPQIIQTDNGFEFTYSQEYHRTHPFDILCKNLNIRHQLIRPRTPQHNGKVERSHRTDQERFYDLITFYSYQDLITQMERYRRRVNNTPMSVLGWMSPMEMRRRLEYTLNQ